MVIKPTIQGMLQPPEIATAIIMCICLLVAIATISSPSRALSDATRSADDASVAYLSGNVVVALSIWQREAEGCRADALTNIGSLYQQGRHVGQSNIQALAHFMLAQDLGSRFAGHYAARVSRPMTSNEREEARTLAESMLPQCRRGPGDAVGTKKLSL